VIYLDDLLILHQNQNHLKRIISQITLFFQHLGWTVNLKKSNLIPSHQLKYLGWIWNSTDISVQFPKEEYPSTIEKNEEENLLQKMHTSDSISQIDSKIIGYSNPVPGNLIIA
jgi:hypothetical protein